MSESHTDAGRRGEFLAREYLIQKGYRVLSQNFRFRRGEIDLILESPEGELVFAEVKSNRGQVAGDPAAWVNARKQRQIQRVAQSYCLLNQETNRPMRFDVLAVNLEVHVKAKNRVHHIPHAFIPESIGYFH